MEANNKDQEEHCLMQYDSKHHPIHLKEFKATIEVAPDPEVVK